MKYRKIEINEENWNAVHDIEGHLPFSFSCGDPSNHKITKSLNLKILPGVKIGELSETMSLPEKAVMHELMDIEGYSVNTKSTIPFGSEPAISRQFDYLPNIIKATTDIHIKRPITAKNFEIDSLQLTGNWKKYAVINLSPEKDDPKKIKWIKIPLTDSQTHRLTDSQTHRLIYNSPSHFHIFLLEAEDGTRLEIGAGFDLFRWKCANEHCSEVNSTPPPGKFTIEHTKEGIFIKRQIMTSDTEFEIHAHNWRFNWYIAWKMGGGQRSEVREQMAEKRRNGIAVEGRARHDRELPIDKTGNHTGIAPTNCFHAKTTRNQLRQSVRSVINKLNGDILHLSNITPRLCTNPSHISRPGKENLEHWDITDIIDFWFWANRQLLKTESKFIITPPKGSIFEQLPSFCSLREHTI